MEDGRSHPQIVALLPPGPSNRNVNAMNSLGNLSDDVLLQTVARPPRTYLGAPGNPLAPQNRDSQAAVWELSVIFTPEGPSGETWMCCARPREGAAGVENPFDPTGPKICGFIMVFRDPSNCNKHMRRHHSGEWASATVGRPTSLAGNARRQREVAAALGLQTQLPYMGNREREAHNERFVLMCALDLRPPHMNSHVGLLNPSSPNFGPGSRLWPRLVGAGTQSSFASSGGPVWYPTRSLIARLFVRSGDLSRGSPRDVRVTSTSGLKPRKKLAIDLSVSKFLKTVFSSVVSVFTLGVSRR
jgi:hypothetical protein